MCEHLLCIYFVCVGDISFEIKTEADSSDITEYPHDDMPSTGMFVFIDGQFPCTAFVFIFHVSVVLPCTSAQTTIHILSMKFIYLSICPPIHLYTSRLATADKSRVSIHGGPCKMFLTSSTSLPFIHLIHVFG